MSDYFIHEQSDVQSDNIGAGTRVWQFSVILKGAKIGKDCNICAQCFVESDVIVGDNCTLKNGVYLWNGTRLEDGVFVGPNVSFTNDKYPRSRQNFDQTGIIVKKGASIGAGAVICPGVTIGEGAMVGAGAVVTKDVAPRVTVAGCPAKELK